MTSTSRRHRRPLPSPPWHRRATAADATTSRSSPSTACTSRPNRGIRLALSARWTRWSTGASPAGRTIRTRPSRTEASRRRARRPRTPTNGDHPQQVMPRARPAHLDDIGRELIGPAAERVELASGTDATTERWEPGPEDVRHQDELVVLTDGAVDPGLFSQLSRCPHELGMGIAHLVLGQTAFAVLADEEPARQTMIDDALGGASHRLGPERHGGQAIDNHSASRPATPPSPSGGLRWRTLAR
jgi:hypothetical protein